MLKYIPKSKVRDDLNEYATLFEAYEVKDGDTPSSLAFELFDDQFLDWVIVLINDMVDIYSEWPKSLTDLEAYTKEVYEDPDAIHHWETNEVLWKNVVYQHHMQNLKVSQSNPADGTTHPNPVL